MKICRVSDMRRLDNLAISDFGIPAEILMENAGQAVYQVIGREADIPGHQFVVLCGPGNNGGDGFVVARLLSANGAKVKVFILAESAQYREAAKRNLDILSRYSAEIDDSQSINKIRNAVESADYIIDALFGTGLHRDVDGIIKQIIALVNQSTKTVFSVDIPSGCSGDNGQEMGVSIQADYTVTFGLPKIGNLLYPGYDRGGKLYVSHISLPTRLTEAKELNIEIPVPKAIPTRKAEANKMDYGPALVIAGAANYMWAPFASTYSFLKSGGGYVYLACPKSLIRIIARHGKEMVFQPQAETPSGSLAYSNKNNLLALAQKMKFVVIGPGLSLDTETQRLVQELVLAIDKPLLIDGDGITAVALQTKIIQNRRYPTILTPHTGEMARLTGKNHQEIENSRIDILRVTAKYLNATIVLKGPHSLVGYPNGKILLNVSGRTDNKAGMATAGSGDVLNGAIAALFCLGLKLEDAVYTGVFIHGLAGDLAAKKKGTDGMTAKDILDNLPAAVKFYRDNLKTIARDYNGTIHLI